MIGGRLAPAKFATGGGHGDAAKSAGPALIDVQFTLPGGQVVSTSTATLRLVRDVTQEEPAP